MRNEIQEKMQHEMSATWKSAMRKVLSVKKSSERKGTMKRAKQDTGQKWRSKLEKVQHEKNEAWKECYMRRYAKEKRCNMKRVQHEKGVTQK